jgi:hypothetical protein
MDAPAWPLGRREEQLLDQLAVLVERGGAWRFLRAPVVAADRRDYPDPWEESRAGVGRALARTMWHAHLDLEVALHDVREPAFASRDRLRDTSIELADVDDRRATFALSAIGNDDVAGACCHEVGRALVAQLARAGHPFRHGDDGLPDAARGSIAAVYGGLGVIAANSARYDRSAGEVIGRTAVHEHKIAAVGGLDSRELAFLLAVQATVRDDVLPALDTLHRTQAEDVAAWREILDDHEDALIARLGLGELGAAIARPPAPRAAIIEADVAEGDLHKQNRGHRVFYVRSTQAISAAVLGMIAGVVPGVIVMNPVALIGGPLVGMVGGFLYGRRVHYFSCASCGGFVRPRDAECKMCGGTLAGEIKRASDRLAREEELEHEEAARAGD